MPKIVDRTFKRVDFNIPPQKIREVVTWHLSDEILSDRQVAQPLFDAAIQAIALARKKTYPEHPGGKIPWNELMLVLQGNMIVQHGKRTFVQGPGMISFCPAGEFFNRHAEGPTWWIYAYLSDKPIWEPLKKHGSYVRQYESTAQMLLLLSRILEAQQSLTITSKLRAVEDSRALAELIKHEIRIVSERSNIHSENLNRLVSEIHQAPQRPWAVPDMAKSMNMSIRSLSRLFHRDYGMAPMDMVIRKRMDLAGELLVSTDHKLEVISKLVGYKSVYSFSNLFIHHVGIRPREFRNKYCSEKMGVGK